MKDQFATRGRADHRRLAHPRRQRPRRGRHRGGAPHRGRRHPARQAEPHRVRARRHDPLSLRPAAQPLEHRPRHRAARRPARGWRWRPGSARSRSARTPAARCDHRPRGAASPATGRRGASSRVTAASRSAGRSTRRARSAAPSRTARWRSCSSPGRTPRDPLTTRRAVPNYRAALTRDVRGLRVGVIRELTHGAETDPEMRAAVVARRSTCSATSARRSPRSRCRWCRGRARPSWPSATRRARRCICTWLRSRPADYDEGTRRRLLAAGLLPAALVHKAQQARGAHPPAAARRARAPTTCCVAPTAHRPAPAIASFTAPITSRAEAATRFFTRRSFTTPAALAGVPALAVPCGFSAAGLPLSLQIIGRRFDDATVLRVGHAYEQATDWHRRRPAIR